MSTIGLENFVEASKLFQILSSLVVVMVVVQVMQILGATTCCTDMQVPVSDPRRSPSNAAQEVQGKHLQKEGQSQIKPFLCVFTGCRLLVNPKKYHGGKLSTRTISGSARAQQEIQKKEGKRTHHLEIVRFCSSMAQGFWNIVRNGR